MRGASTLLVLISSWHGYRGIKALRGVVAEWKNCGWSVKDDSIIPSSELSRLIGDFI
jgi:hypothetical protein